MADRGMTHREYAERYAGMTFDGSERSPIWDQPVPESWPDLAAEGRRMQFVVIDGDQGSLGDGEQR